MHIVSVSSLKGGVGKTTVVLGLASAALHAGIRTLVIDLDPHADASTALGVHATKGSDIGALLRRPKAGSAARAAVASSWTKHPITPQLSTPKPGQDLVAEATPSEHSQHSGATPPPLPMSHGMQVASVTPVLDVIPGSAASSRMDHAAYNNKDLRRLSTVLEDLHGYDLVIIDCPPTLSALTRMAWAASHKVLSVAEPSLFSVAGTKRTMTALAQFEPLGSRPTPAAGVIINSLRPQADEHRHRVKELNELFGKLVVEPTIPDEPVMQQIQGAAWPVHRWPGAAASELSRRFSTILEGLMG